MRGSIGQMEPRVRPRDLARSAGIPPRVVGPVLPVTANVIVSAMWVHPPEQNMLAPDHVVHAPSVSASVNPRARFVAKPSGREVDDVGPGTHPPSHRFAI